MHEQAKLIDIASPNDHLNILMIIKAILEKNLGL